MSRSTIIIFAGILIILACCFEPSKFEYTINDPKDPNTTWRTEKPLTYAEAISFGHCPIALPKNATNIQYVDFYAGYGGFRTLVRFEAPVSTCREHAKKVLMTRNSIVTATNMKVRIGALALDKSIADSVASSARDGGEKVSRAPWFDADAIKNGEIWGEWGSHMPLILIDTNRGVFYYRLSD